MNYKNKEKWKNVKGFENYLVSNKGRIMNGKTGKILRPYDSHGYEKVDLYQNGKRKKLKVHRLVAQAFIDNPHNFETVNHLDEVKVNNKADNLEWLSLADNIRYSHCKPVEMYDLKSGRLLCTFNSLTECSRLTGFDDSTISKACRGQYKKAYGYIWRYKD